MSHYKHDFKLDKKLLIDLDQSDKNTPVQSGDLIQYRRYEQLTIEIGRHLNALPEPRYNENFPNGSGWVVFLDGTRGAGKSTFLSSVQYNLECDPDIRGKMEFVALIDPSRIERSEIILLVILQQLRNRVSQVLDADRRQESEQVREEWRRAFRGVAGGLTLFAKEHHPLNDLDPDLFLDWGLERAGDSTNLRTRLHRLFEIACRILKVRALMVAFDDADTDATHAIDLLECIRKYLDNPRFMVLVTGDMELYSLLVRQHFVETVVSSEAKTWLPYAEQGDRSSQYLRMIDHLEEQYLLKLFPIRRRMQLQPLWNLLLEARRHGDSYEVTTKVWDTNRIQVDDFLGILVKEGLRVKANSDVELYKEFLLKQPLRSLLQVMSHSAPHLNLPVDLTKISPARPINLIAALSRSLQALALTSLYRFSVDTDAIAAHELPALTQAVFDLSIRDGDIDTAPYLRPMAAEQNIKNCFVALAAEVPNFCSGRPGVVLRYLFRGPGSVSLYALARETSPYGPSFREEENRQFKQYVGIGRKEDALDWARRATAIIATPHGISPKARVVRTGVIGLNRKKPNGAGTRLHTFRTAIDKAIQDKNVVSFPVFALSLIDVTGASAIRTYASIFNLVGLVEKLLSLRAPDRESIRSVLRKAYPSVTLSAPSWIGHSSIDDMEILHGGETEEGSDTEEEAEKLEVLVGLVEVWLREVEPLFQYIAPSAIFLGKIWTRLFFSLEKAADDLRDQEKFSDVMEIFSLCVINAFLVEEAEHHVVAMSTGLQRELQIDRTNPKTSARRYVKKLMRMEFDRNNLPMTAIMATCPLLLGLLDKDAGYEAALRNFFPSSGKDEASIKELLRSTAVKEHMEKVVISGSSSRASMTVSRQARSKPTDKARDSEV